MDRRPTLCILFAFLTIHATAGTAHAEEPGAEEPRSPALFGVEQHGIGGYGGPYFKVSQIAGKTTVLGGGPLLVFMLDDAWSAGLIATSTEADADGLQLTYLGLAAEVDLFADRWFHLMPGVTLIGGGAIADVADGTRSSAPIFGFEPQLAIGADVLPATRIVIIGGWRFAWATDDLGGLDGRSVGGPSVGLQIREGLFRPGVPTRRVSLVGAYSARWTTLNGELTYLDGGGTRVRIGRHWAFGIGGYVTRDWFDAAPESISGGWGGLTAEYLFLPDSIVLPWVGLLAGGGGLGRVTYDPDTGEQLVESNGLIVVEPTVGVQVGVFEFLRLAVGGGYRLAACMGCIAGLDTSKTSGPSAVLELRFGHF